MLIIFIVGGFIPLFISEIMVYSFASSNRLNQAINRGLGQMELASSNLSECVKVLSAVSNYIYLDKRVGHSDIFDYPDNNILTQYERNYSREVADIVLYHYNVNCEDTDDLCYAGADIKAQKWYIETVARKGEPYWYYYLDPDTFESGICLSRAIYDADGKRFGVVSITMNLSTSQELLSRMELNTFLLFDNITIISNNSDYLYTDDVLYSIMDNGKGKVLERREVGTAVRTEYNKRDSLLFYSRMLPQGSDEYLTLVSVLDYGAIMRNTMFLSLLNFVPFFIFSFIAFFLISWFTRSYSKRLNYFRYMMHEAAVGRDVYPDQFTGTDEIGMLARDLSTIMQETKRLGEESNELSRNLMEEKLKTEMLHTREREVEFRMLSSQINPHFLYNTLETIRMQALVNGDKEAAKLAKMLAYIMRHNLKVQNSLEPVSEELRLVEYYMQIQDYRFRDRIAYELVYDEEDIKELYMIPLCIQPFVENAYVHGLEKLESGGRITVTVTKTDCLTIEIEDNGHGMDEKTLSEIRGFLRNTQIADNSHIGIRNVSGRINLLYGDGFGVEMDSKPGEGTKITIKLPVIYDTGK